MRSARSGSRSLLEFHFSDAGHQPQLPVRDDLLTRIESSRDDRLSVCASVEDHRAGFHRHIRLDDENELTLLPILNRLRRYHDSFGLLSKC